MRSCEFIGTCMIIFSFLGHSWRIMDQMIFFWIRNSGKDFGLSAKTIQSLRCLILYVVGHTMPKPCKAIGTPSVFLVHTHATVESQSPEIQKVMGNHKRFSGLKIEDRVLTDPHCTSSEENQIEMILSRPPTQVSFLHKVKIVHRDIKPFSQK